MRLLSDSSPVGLAVKLLDEGKRVPGWGNSFIKGPDSTFARVDQRLREMVPLTMERVDKITAFLHECGRVLYPNPSTYTAACALALGIPERIVPYLLIMGRLEAWTALSLDCKVLEE
jgi:citrate synthase